MRVQSPRTFTFKNGDVGWIHAVGNDKPIVRPARVDKTEHLPSKLIEGMIGMWSKQTNGHLLELSTSLGVRASSLLELRVCWAERHNAFAFPMRDGNGDVCGIRFRSMNGEKWSLKGSRNGLFMPWCEPEPELYVCEGGTDVCALRSLNLFAVGRPSCSGGMMDIKTLVTRLRIRRVYILADNDKPGLGGADSLARNLQVPCCVLTLPVKDIREFYNCGGTYQILESISRSSFWRNSI